MDPLNVRLTRQPDGLLIDRKPSNTYLLSDFELHYDFDSSNSVLPILRTITQDLLSHRPIHNWDEKLVGDPVKDLAKYASRQLQLGRLELRDGSFMLRYSAANEVCTIHGINCKIHAHQRPFPKAKEMKSALADLQGSNGSKTPEIAYGRVVSTKELIPDIPRAFLLLVHCFCLRLQDEDFTFIERFVQRHLRLKATYKEPYQLQDTSPLDKPGRCYKRISFSFHLTHLLLQPWQDSDREPEALDREFLGYFAPDQRSLADAHKARLYKASSSVLLTLVIPEEQESREEALDLLARPEALWTVLIINGPTHVRDGFFSDPVEYLTPLAQFIRGICGVINSQRMNIDPVFAELKKQLVECSAQSTLQTSGTAHLFDDHSFSNSKLYHWIIKICYEISSSIETNLKFVRNFENSQLPKLQGRAHSYEASGLAHWIIRLREETAELDTVQTEVHAFKEQVRELREALFGATALLESRIAVMQGDRIKMLTYLSMAYLPITTVASLYSMTVLPAQATLGSFFIVLAIVLIITFVLALNLQDLLSFMSSILNHSPEPPSLYDEILAFNEKEKDKDPIITPDASSSSSSTKSKSESRASVFIHLLKSLPPREIRYGVQLFYRPRAHFYEKLTFSFGKLGMDLARLLLLPLWMVLAVLGACGLAIWRLCQRIRG